MSRQNINILAEQYVRAMVVANGGEETRYIRSFTRIINFHEIDTAVEAVTDAATPLEHYSIVPPPKDDRWTQQLGDHGEAAWLRD